MSPATFMVPCMNAALVSSSPCAIFNQSSYGAVIVTSGSAIVPRCDSSSFPFSSTQEYFTSPSGPPLITYWIARGAPSRSG